MSAPWGPPPTLTWFTDAGTFTGTLDQLTAHLGPWEPDDSTMIIEQKGARG